MSWIVRFFGFLEETRVPAPWKGVPSPSSIRIVSSYVNPDVLREHVALFQRSGKMTSYRPLPNQFSASFHSGMVLKCRA
jgi:hypothetical protein